MTAYPKPARIATSAKSAQNRDRLPHLRPPFARTRNPRCGRGSRGARLLRGRREGRVGQAGAWGTPRHSLERAGLSLCLSGSTGTRSMDEPRGPARRRVDLRRCERDLGVSRRNSIARSAADRRGAREAPRRRLTNLRPNVLLQESIDRETQMHPSMLRAYRENSVGRGSSGAKSIGDSAWPSSADLVDLGPLLRGARQDLRTRRRVVRRRRWVQSSCRRL